MIWELMSSSEVVSNGQFSFATWPQEGTFLTCQVFIDWDFIHQWYITSLCLLISSHLLQMAGSERNHTGSFSQMPMSRLLETMRQPLGEKRKKKDNPFPHVPQLWLVSLSLFFIILFPYFWLCWVCVAKQAFLQLQGVDRSPWWLLRLWSTGSRSWSTGAQEPWLPRSRAVSTAAAHGLSGSVTRGTSPDQGLKLWPLHWQADS